MKNNNIISQFEKVVKKYSEKNAVVFFKQKLTFKELKIFSDVLADFIIETTQQSEVKPYSIAIMIDKSVYIPGIILGVLKTGNYYLPIDPDYPSERIEYLLNDSKIKVIIHDFKNKNIINKIKYRIELDKVINKFKSLYKNNIELENDNLKKISNIINADNYAYIIYTSGSTGLPKGAIITHGNILNLVKAQNLIFKFNNNDVIIQQASISFDASVWEIMPALLKGLTLVIVDKNTMLSYRKFVEYMNKNNVTIFTSGPTYLSNLNPQDFNTLRIVISAGEQLPINIAKKWSKYFEFYNAYGPTETTVCATVFKVNSNKIDKYDIIPIGKPIYGVNCYIFDKNLKKVKPGNCGELYIGGNGVSKGYINKPELTAERFIKNPYYNLTSKNIKNSINKEILKDDILYKTGDIVKIQKDGNLVFIGRNDFQIKIKGYRIEIGEIENTVLRHEKIEECVVLVIDIKNKKELICFYTSKSELSPEELKIYLKLKLPDYMIPHRLIKIESFKVNVHGKIDRGFLINLFKQKYENYINRKLKSKSRKNQIPKVKKEEIKDTVKKEISRKINLIFLKILNLKEIANNESFFSLGGDSLELMKLAIELEKEFKIKIPVDLLYNNSSVYEITKIVKNLKTNNILNLNIINISKIVKKVLKCDFIFKQIEINYDNNNKIKKKFILICEKKKCFEILSYIRHYNIYSLPDIYIEMEKLSAFEYDLFKNNNIFNYFDLNKFITKNTITDAKFKKISNIIDNQLFKFLDNQKNTSISNVYSVLHPEKFKNFYNPENQLKIKEKPIIFEIDIPSISYIKIKKMIKDFISQQKLLYTFIERKNNKYIYYEPENLYFKCLNFIDLQNYRIKDVDKVLDLIKQKLKKIIYLNENKLILFNYYIIKISQFKIKIIFVFDHLISNLETQNILARYFIKNINFNKIYQFSEYIKKIYYPEDREEKYLKLVNSKFYRKFVNILEKLNRDLKRFESRNIDEKPIILSEPVILLINNNLNKIYNSDNLSYFNFSLFFSINIISLCFGINNIPIRIFIDNRLFKNLNFYNTIGDFTDSLICLFDKEKLNTINDYKEAFQKINSFFIENNIALKSYRDKNEILNRIYRNTIFSLNYIGIIDKETFLYIKKNTKHINVIKYPIMSFRIKNSNNLVFIFHNGLRNFSMTEKFLQYYNLNYKFINLQECTDC